MSFDERMRQFEELMYAGGVARPGDLRGCSAAEIAALEQKWGLRLPKSYTAFLSVMGHSMGQLGNDGEFELGYAHALKLNEETVVAWKNNDHLRQSAAQFPANGLVFCQRAGVPHYWVIICDGRDDSSVFRFDYESDPIQFKQTSRSLFEFLEELRRDAEVWVRHPLSNME